MKSKKGFTLIELLAVIVILAIIALIAVPQILKLLNQARLSAAEDSTYGIIEATETLLAKDVIYNQLEGNNFEFDCNEDEVCVTSDGIEIEYKGKRVTGGFVRVRNRSEIQVEDLVVLGFVCNKDYDETKVHCTPGNGGNSTVIDNNPGVICGDGTVENYDSITDCHIKSLEDFEAFTNLVNTSNKNFSGKNVYLDTSLNFKNESFDMVGSSTSFSGNLYGNGKTLSNITISSTEDNVGIFRTNSGTIQNLKLNNLKVASTGDSIGGLVGTNYGTIKGITGTNIEVEGNSEVGGLVGFHYSSSISTVMIGSKVSGNDKVGGVVGGNNNSATTSDVLVTSADITCNDTLYCSAITGTSDNSTGIVESGNITGTNNRIGCVRWGIELNNSDYGYCLNDFTINGTDKSDYTKGDNMLSVYNPFIDTIINGDNGDGYYFDYDKNGNIIIKNTTSNPITFNLSGAGTSSSPYLIKSAKDWNEATLMINDDTKYFKLNNDIDFQNKEFYSWPEFRGHLDGDGHTLMNIKLHGISRNYGIIAYNRQGVIENLKLSGVSVTGTANYVGALVGKNEGTIKGITATSILVEGDYAVGGIVGHNNAGTVKTILIDASVSGYDYVGGEQGLDNYSAPRDVLVTNITLNCHDAMECSGISASWDGGKHGVVEAGNITGTNDRIGCFKWGVDATDTYYGYCLNGVKINNVTQTTYAKGNDPLTQYNPFIDTHIDGDDWDGYYFGYDSNNNIIIVKAS